MTKTEPHLSVEALEGRYKAADETIAENHFHAVGLLASGRSVDEVAELPSFSTRWVKALIKRYNKGGPERLGDQRANNGTEPTSLTPQASERAQAADQDSARRWRSPQVCVYPSIGLRDCVPRCMAAHGDRRPMCDVSPTTNVISANRCAGVFEPCETTISDRPQETTVAGDGLPADIGGLFRS
jgi:hypothetical protein